MTHNTNRSVQAAHNGLYKGVTFEHVRDGRLREWQDQIAEEASKAEKPAAAEAGRARREGLKATG